MKTVLNITLTSPRMPHAPRMGSSRRNSASAYAVPVVPPYLGTCQKPKLYTLTDKRKKKIIKLLLLREKHIPVFFDSSPKKKEHCFISRLYKALYGSSTTHLSEGENSIYYIDQFNVDGKGTTLTLRVSNHNANAENFKKDSSEYGYSVVGKKDKEKVNASRKLIENDKEKIMEFTYVNPTTATCRNIINRIIIFLSTGEYSDPTASDEQNTSHLHESMTKEEAEEEYAKAEAEANRIAEVMGVDVEQLKEEKKSETQNNTMKKRKKKGLQGTPTEPTDIKEMFASLPVEGLEVKNIFYRTEDVLLCQMPDKNRLGHVSKWLILARKGNGIEKIVERVEDLDGLVSKPVYNSEEWWSGIYLINESSLYVVPYVLRHNFIREDRHRMIFASPRLMIYAKNGDPEFLFLYASKKIDISYYSHWGWSPETGLFYWKWQNHTLWLDAMKEIENDFPDGKFVDSLLDEEPASPELVYDSLRFSINCNASHSYAWLVVKKTSGLPRKSLDLIHQTFCDLDDAFPVLHYEVRFFNCTRPNIEKAISIIEKRFRPGKRYGIAAGEVDTPAQARARATKTAAKAKIKIARMKRA